MPVTLAGIVDELLDILGIKLADATIPEDPRRAFYRALVAVETESREVNARSEPLPRSLAERLQACYLALQELAPVRDDASGEFQASPRFAFLCLYAALERAEMQELAAPSPDLYANEIPPLPLLGDPYRDMSRHQEGEGTR